MREFNYKKLKHYHGLDAEKTVKELREGLQNKHLDPNSFSIRECAEECLGPSRVKAMDPRQGGSASLLEAGDGVDVTAFSNITGQLIYSKIMDTYEQEAFVMSGLVQTIPTRLDGEKIPGIARLTDETPEVHPGMPFPSLGFGEDYIETPSTTKHGFIVPVTKEAVFFDRTNLILQRAAEVGTIIGINKEKRLLDLALGFTNNYKWKGTTYDTYSVDGVTGGDGGTALTGVINQLTDVLVDWTDVDAAEMLFADILEPNTGEPVLITANTLLVPPALMATGFRILNATELKYGADSGAVQTMHANPLGGQYKLAISRLAYRRLIANGVSASDAKKYWFLGDFNKAFAYMENWPITVTQAPSNSEAEFTQDIVARYKVSERGVAAVMNPRYVVRSTGAG